MLDEGAAADAQEAAAITQYNNLLATNLANFTSSHTGVTAKIVNTTTAFQTVIDNPTAYGAANATCFDDDGSTCVWWNNYHPGLASKSLVAESSAENSPANFVFLTVQGLVAEEVADAFEGSFFK